MTPGRLPAAARAPPSRLRERAAIERRLSRPRSLPIVDLAVSVRSRFAIVGWRCHSLRPASDARVLLPIRGFFAGFAFDDGRFAGLADERFPGSALGCACGFVPP